MCIRDSVGTNPLESAIRSPTLGNCESTTERIDTYLAGDGLERSYDYYRYWHGYAVISRPLLAVVGLAGLRLLSTMRTSGRRSLPWVPRRLGSVISREARPVTVSYTHLDVYKRQRSNSSTPTSARRWRIWSTA